MQDKHETANSGRANFNSLALTMLLVAGLPDLVFAASVDVPWLLSRLE